MSDLDFDFTAVAPTKTARVSLGSVFRWHSDQPIALIVKHAGDGNPEFISARIKTPQGADRRAAYERVARLYARHVVVGWEHVNRPDGTPAEFSHAGAEKLLLALVAASRLDAIDYLSAFCSDHDNFHDPITTAADLGKG